MWRERTVGVGRIDDGAIAPGLPPGPMPLSAPAGRRMNSMTATAPATAVIARAAPCLQARLTRSLRSIFGQIDPLNCRVMFVHRSVRE